MGQDVERDGGAHGRSGDVLGPSAADTLEVWGGMECTVNRVGDQYHDQLRWSGHDDRADDLEEFAALGLRYLRYPILWERTQEWRQTDARMRRVRALGIQPIVGLLHHGSGPMDTSLVDHAFPTKLAGFAARVAERYPWVDRYTPVNEPFTTARFSCLYGLWYPHLRSARACVRALLLQCRGIVLSMREIRRVNPTAQLVQTEDLGRVSSRPALQYQADFENHRRWLTWDLLCGRVDRDHALDGYFRHLGIERHELDFFLDNPCPPDIIGVNHYVTSDRYLDDRLALYPEGLHGGNGRDAYVDVEAVRMLDREGLGVEAALREAWERYRLPVAVTEAHLGCTREEQMRWLDEVWTTAHRVRGMGADVRAVTVWSLLGTFDWESLVTRPTGLYECGVFDVRGGHRRPTALHAMTRRMAQGGRSDHAVLNEPGWWHRAERLARGAVRPPRAPSNDRRARRLLVTGATGTLGQAVRRLCERRGISHELTSRARMDIADEHAVGRVLNEVNPWAIVNTAGYVRVDEAEADHEACERENVDGAAILARACAARNIPFVTFSSDLVFDGKATYPYRESDAVAPLNVYGHSKADAETRVLSIHPAALVIRTSAFFGPWDAHNFVTSTLQRLSRGERVRASEECVISPTYVPDLASAALDLLIDAAHGVWHVANPGQTSWADLARLVARRAGLSDAGVESATPEDLSWRAARPRYSVLGSERGSLLPPLDDALGRYFTEARP